MGEAKRRRANKPEPQYAVQVPKLSRFEITVPTETVPALRQRHSVVRGQWPTFAEFLGVLAIEGVQVFDRDIRAAFDAEQGKAKPIDPEAGADPDRKVLLPHEVQPGMTKALADVHQANLMGGRV